MGLVRWIPINAMKLLHKRILALAFILSLSLSLPILADPGTPGGSPAGTEVVGGGGNSGVPLDGGIIELLVAGAVLAGFRAVKKKKE